MEFQIVAIFQTNTLTWLNRLNLRSPSDGEHWIAQACVWVSLAGRGIENHSENPESCFDFYTLSVWIFLTWTWTGPAKQMAGIGTDQQQPSLLLHSHCFVWVERASQDGAMTGQVSPCYADQCTRSWQTQEVLVFTTTMRLLQSINN